MKARARVDCSKQDLEHVFGARIFKCRLRETLRHRYGTVLAPSSGLRKRWCSGALLYDCTALRISQLLHFQRLERPEQLGKASSAPLYNDQPRNSWLKLKERGLHRILALLGGDKRDLVLSSPHRRCRAKVSPSAPINTRGLRKGKAEIQPWQTFAAACPHARKPQQTPTFQQSPCTRLQLQLHLQVLSLKLLNDPQPCDTYECVKTGQLAVGKHLRIVFSRGGFAEGHLTHGGLLEWWSSALCG